jgi:hypothetical protein
MYKVNNVEYDEFSAVNKKIISMFEKREIRSDVTPMVEYILDTGTNLNDPPFSIEDIEEPEISGVCPYCGCLEDPEEVHPTNNAVLVAYDPTASEDERYQCPICGAGYATEAEARACCVGETLFVCPDCGNQYTQDEIDIANAEANDDAFPNQWFIVSPWLCDKLRERDETVILSSCIWGRLSETDISEDEAIVEICKDIGILEGQQNDWSKK